MRRKFKNEEDARDYFSGIDVNTLTRPSDFGIIDYCCNLFDSNSYLFWQRKFWQELRQKYTARMKELGWIVITPDNLDEATKALSELIGAEGVSNLICKLGNWESYSDEELAVFKRFAEQLDDDDKLFDIIQTEIMRRHPNHLYN